MKTNWFRAVVLAAVAGFGLAGTVGATVLSFDIYTDAPKTLYNNNVFVPQTYGDNVTDFTPAAPVSGLYYNYGSAGGPTPGVTVDYGWFTTANPAANGPSYVTTFNFGYTGLTNVAYPTPGATFHAYISLTLTSTADQAMLESFQAAPFGGALPGQTLKVVTNLLSGSPVTLWAAGPDQGYTVLSNTLFQPNLTFNAGETLYFVFGESGLLGIDNLTFSQITQIPEPSAVVLLLGGLALVRWWRAGRRA